MILWSTTVIDIHAHWVLKLGGKVSERCRLRVPCKRPADIYGAGSLYESSDVYSSHSVIFFTGDELSQPCQRAQTSDWRQGAVR